MTDSPSSSTSSHLDRMVDFHAREAATRKASRQSLANAARMARSSGWAVSKSTARDGSVSSYYCRTNKGTDVRLSDHESIHGFRDEGAQVIIDKPRSKTWLRRALMLAENGRNVIFWS